MTTRRASRRGALRLAALAAFCLVAPLAGAAAPPHAEPTARERPAIDQLTGRYRFVGGKAELDALEAAIDDVVGDMNFFVRGTARSRLRDAAKIPSALAIARRGNWLTVTIADADYTAPLDGSPVRVKGPSGDPVWLRHRDLGQGQLWQHFDSDDGIRINTCRPLAGNRMRIRVTIRSEDLPKPLTFAMTFARRAPRRGAP